MGACFLTQSQNIQRCHQTTHFPCLYLQIFSMAFIPIQRNKGTRSKKRAEVKNKVIMEYQRIFLMEFIQKLRQLRTHLKIQRTRISVSEIFCFQSLYSLLNDFIMFTS